MRIFSRAYRLVLAALVLGACQAEPVAPPQVRQTIRASLEREEAVKSILDPTDDTQVLWTAHEQVNVFVGDASYRFTGDNTDAAASATFSGEGPADLGTYVMLSPYNESASKSGDNISTTLPAAQIGLADGYRHGTALTAGRSSTASVTCRQVCSGIRFKVGRNDVTAVVLQGNGGEGIAGNFTFSFSDGIPVATSGTESIITLSAPGGGTFESDKYYYIVTLPAVFSQGITLTAYAGTKVGSLIIPTADLSFSRGIFKNLTSSLNDRMTWDDTASVSVYYGPQNSFCIRPGSSNAIEMDVSPRRIADNWQRSGLAAPSGSVPTSCSTLWGDAVAQLNGTALTVYSETTGSSLVAIKNGETILWSFLVWVTASAPAETTIGSYQVLPPLGGQLYFQWGRKDPLLPTSGKVANQGDNGLAYSIANPLQFITKGDNAYDWFCNDTDKQDGTLWGNGGSKTVWDPCPAGYRVPVKTVFSTLISQESAGEGFDALGYLTEADDTHPTEPLYWTSTPAGGSAYSLFVNTSNVYEEQSDTRFIAAPLRCVKE